MEGRSHALEASGIEDADGTVVACGFCERVDRDHSVDLTAAEEVFVILREEQCVDRALCAGQLGAECKLWFL